jgi:hypothetical protein
MYHAKNVTSWEKFAIFAVVKIGIVLRVPIVLHAAETGIKRYMSASALNVMEKKKSSAIAQVEAEQ